MRISNSVRFSYLKSIYVESIKTVLLHVMSEISVWRETIPKRLKMPIMNRFKCQGTLVPVQGGAGKVCNRASVFFLLSIKNGDSSMDLPLYHPQVPSRNEFGSVERYFFKTNSLMNNTMMFYRVHSILMRILINIF